MRLFLKVKKIFFKKTNKCLDLTLTWKTKNDLTYYIIKKTIYASKAL